MRESKISPDPGKRFYKSQEQKSNSFSSVNHINFC